MKKIAVITDTHLTTKNGDLVKSIFKQTFEAMKSRGINTLFHGGDWFTARTGQTVRNLKATLDIINMSEEYDIQIYAIAGNHDKDDQEAHDSFLDPFEKDGVFKLFRKLGSWEHPDLNVHMLPYYPEDGERYIEYLGELNEKCGQGINILITHTAVNGVKNNDGSEVTSGISKNKFGKFDLVFVGHYHNKSKVGSNIHYIGSAYQANFGEDDDKGFIIYDSETKDIERVRLNFPKYITKEIKASEAIASCNDIINTGSVEDFLRVKITGSEDEVNAVSKDLFNLPNIKVEKILEIEGFVDLENVEAVTFDKESLQAEWGQFTKDKKIKKENEEMGVSYLKKI